MQLHFYRKDDFFYEFLTLKLTSLGKRFFELGQTCSESQKVKSSQSHDFDFFEKQKKFGLFFFCKSAPSTEPKNVKFSVFWTSCKNCKNFSQKDTVVRPNLSPYLFRTVPYRTVPYRTVSYRTVLYRTVSYLTVFHFR